MTASGVRSSQLDSSFETAVRHVHTCHDSKQRDGFHFAGDIVDFSVLSYLCAV